VRDRLRRPANAVAKRLGIIGSLVSVRTAEPQIVLTFDDGPDPRGTDEVLTALAEHRSTATFFILLTRVRRYPGLLESVAAAGHEIALHGADHRRLTDFSYRDAKARTAAAKTELEDLLGKEVRWFRPPEGRQTLASWRAVTGCGLTPVLWGPTTWDWRQLSQRERVAKAQEGAEQGAILLGHDAFADELDGAVSGPAPELDRHELIVEVLDRYRDRGLAGVSLGRALEQGRAVKEARFRR
jgi:peptidoglycan/xylan/chitin deacetylase (PgdA/CDA1 family)